VPYDKETFARQPNNNEGRVSESMHPIEGNDGTGNERHIHRVWYSFPISPRHGNDWFLAIQHNDKMRFVSAVEGSV
jgi:hypothetical protein